MSERLDVVAIISGDGDFVELVNFLKARGIRVEVYSFPYSTAEELRTAATEYYQMGQDLVMNPSRAGFPANGERSNGERYDARYENRGYGARGYDNHYDGHLGERTEAGENHESETAEGELFTRSL
jgi:hypothetical protein